MGLAAIAMLGATAPAGAVGPPPGSEYGISSFFTEVKNAAGEDETRASAHPHSARAFFAFNTYDPGPGVSPSNTLAPQRPVEDPRSLSMRLPAGFVGNPQAAGTCPLDTVGAQTNSAAPTFCPEDSFVGWVRVRGLTDLNTPVVNVAPEDGYPAEFGFSEASLTFIVYPELRSDGDYGVNMNVPAINNNFLKSVDTTFCSYGVEMDFIPNNSNFRCREKGEPGAFEKPFLTNSTTNCPAEAPVTVLETDSWTNPGVFKTAQAVSPLITSCDTLEFEPSVDIAPTTTAPDAPSGLDVDMSFPQEDNDEGQAPPALKKAVVTLPEGMTINPSAANGLQACSDAQLKLKSKQPVECPEASKVGTVTAKSPLMEEEISGGVYIRSQNSSDPQSGEMFRLALVLENEKRGISVRLPGQVRADASTGRLVTTFDNNPELPVSSIELDLKSGPRAPLATPPTCGTKTIDIELSSWGGQTVDRTSEFDVDCTAGLGGFSPTFSAGTTDPTGGAFSPFALHIAKPDRDTAMNGVSLEMPTGLLAKIKGNLNTQVGSVRTFAGPGGQPFMLPGTVTLEGAYGDAPYSLRVVVPAKAGPFDLGEVVVRQKVYVDPFTAEVSVVSDPLPTIVKGVPVRLQRVDVLVDKPGFMINPTSCAQKQVDGVLGSAAGQSAPVSARFQASDCADLKFKPRLGLRLTGPRQTRTGKHPGVRAEVRQTGIGEAGIRRARVVLPPSLALDPDNAQALCEFEDGTKPDLEKHCPEGSIVGRARAKTPLLERDLVGNVYFVKNIRIDPDTGNEIRTLPMIVAALRGEIAVNLVGKSSTTKNGRLVNTFAGVPDAPIAKFNLNIKGGQNGILAVTGSRRGDINLCAKPKKHIARTVFRGQNGKVRARGLRVTTPCRAKSTTKTKAKGGR
ncbi:MAG: hypothetical protein GXY03_12370 [Solirubrobacterales bacterium]|nr:hypothetical protein [Solirubrobacterales bacterium]